MQAVPGYDTFPSNCSSSSFPQSDEVRKKLPPCIMRLIHHIIVRGSSNTKSIVQLVVKGSDVMGSSIIVLRDNLYEFRLKLRRNQLLPTMDPETVPTP